MFTAGLELSTEFMACRILSLIGSSDGKVKDIIRGELPNIENVIREKGREDVKMKRLFVIVFTLCSTCRHLSLPSSARPPEAADKPENTETQKPVKRLDTMIAVFDLEARGKVDKDISYPLTESIRREIVKSGKYEVIDRSNMDKVLGEQKLQLSGCVSGECIVEAGQLLGVGRIITGSVSLIGSTYYLSLSLVNVETGKIEDVSEDKCKCEIDDLIDSSKRLVKRLMGEKVESPKEATGFPVKEQTSKSFSLEEMEQDMKREKADWDKRQNK